MSSQVDLGLGSCTSLQLSRHLPFCPLSSFLPFFLLPSQSLEAYHLIICSALIGLAFSPLSSFFLDSSLVPCRPFPRRRRGVPLSNPHQIQQPILFLGHRLLLPNPYRFRLSVLSLPVPRQRSTFNSNGRTQTKTSPAGRLRRRRKGGTASNEKGRKGQSRCCSEGKEDVELLESFGKGQSGHHHQLRRRGRPSSEDDPISTTR
jgi:hypothetical protein